MADRSEPDFTPRWNISEQNEINCWKVNVELRVVNRERCSLLLSTRVKPFYLLLHTISSSLVSSDLLSRTTHVGVLLCRNELKCLNVKLESQSCMF